MFLDKLLNKPKATDPANRFAGGWMPTRTAGLIVDEDTALTYSAVYLAVKIISETLAGLPSNVYSRVPNSSDREIARNHPLKQLLNQPNSEMTGFNFMRTLISHSVLRGNGFAYIDRDRSNRPGALQLITPDRVNKGRDKDTGRIVYEISNGTSANDFIIDDDMFHLPGMGFDGLIGYSIVALAKRSFGLGMAAEQFGSSFYENGAQLGTVIEVPPEIKLDEAGKDLLLKTFDAKHRGVKHHHSTALIDAGMKVQSVGIPQKDAQFIESRKFSITDVARWFNIPPHKLKDLEKATFSNIEEQNIDFVQDTMMPWIINLEQTINWKLVGRNNHRQFVKYNLNGLLRGDAEARAAYYQTRFNMGSISINEIRALEDENGIGTKGDQHFMQMNMSTIDDIIEPPEPKPVTNKPFDDVAADDDDENDSDSAVNFDQFKPLIKNVVSKPFKRISERLANFDGSGEPDFRTWMASHLEQRTEYITASFGDVFLAMTGQPTEKVVPFVDDLIAACAQCFLDGETDHKDAINDLVGDFMVFCANITTTTGGDK